MKENPKKLAILSSGGDAPGMNAAIRAVVRTALHFGMETFGIRRGFQGWVEDSFVELDSHSVGNILQRGGTILKTARSGAFMTKEGRERAYENLKKRGIEHLVLLGGDGTFKGAEVFHNEYPDIKVVGIPCTIDKDIAGTDYTIGFDTAVNTAVEAIDKIRDTAHAHDRLFIVEVMGRDAGYIALHSGIACGAEDILIPERITNMGIIIENISKDKQREKLVRIIVVAEGDDIGGADVIKHLIENKVRGVEPKVMVLGHIQRGGSPSYYDRWMASHFGYHAVEAIMNGKEAVMIGVENKVFNAVPLSEVACLRTKINAKVLTIAKILGA